MTATMTTKATLQYVGIHFGVMIEGPGGEIIEVPRYGKVDVSKEEADRMLTNPQWRLVKPARKDG